MKMLDIDAETYFGIPALSASAIKLADKSPSKFIRSMMGGYDSPQSEAMRRGTLVHMATLEPNRYAAEVKVWSETKTKGARFQKWADQVDGTPVTEAEDELYLAISGAVWSDKIASEYLKEDGPVEATCIPSPLQMRSGGRTLTVPRKCRADKITADCVVDLKTTSRDLSEFHRDVEAYDYDIQAYWYMECTGRDKFVFIAVNPAPPHDVGTFSIERGDQYWQGGERRVREALQSIAMGFWGFGFAESWMRGTVKLEPSPWYMRAHEV